MTSPYIEREAAKLRLVHPAPRVPNVGAHADHDPRDVRFARTQREAGIEHLEWGDRLPPCRSHWLAALIALACPPDMLMRHRRTALRPWMFFAISAACWVVLGLAMAWTLSTF